MTEQAKFLPSVAGLIYNSLRFEDYLGNVGLSIRDVMKILSELSIRRSYDRTLRVAPRTRRLVVLIGIATILASLLIVPTARLSHAAAGKPPPNIVLFIADDLGWNDVGYHGSEIRTPTLDRMAGEGMELDSFYAFPWCSSTRSDLETGINPALFGIRSLQHNFDGNRVIPKTVPTIAEKLQALGYKSYMIGKWHLSTTFSGGPIERGYDGAFGFLYGQIDHYTHQNQNNRPALFRNETPVTEKGHMTDLITWEAKRVISGVDGPVFLNIRYSAPHYPLQAPESYIAQYANIENADRRVYAAMVTQMDDSIGQIIEAVKKSGRMDNTIFLFFSDNGGQIDWLPKDIKKYYGGRFGPYSELGSNLPLKGGKTGVYEGGVRVPAVVYGPGYVEKGKSSQFVSVLDLMPTILRLAGTKESLEYEGLDISALFRGEIIERDVEFYWLTNSGEIPYGGGKQDAVRVGKWKYIQSQQRYWWFPWQFEWPWKKSELYDISNDPNESNNLVDTREDIVQALREKLNQYLENKYFQYK